MLKAWPELHTLALTGGKMPFNAQRLLSTFTYPNLHTLHLPLDFRLLASPLTSPPSQQKSPLRHLVVSPPTLFPPSFKEKLTLVQNLLILLPVLKTMRSGDQRLWNEAADLQCIIQGTLAVVAARRASAAVVGFPQILLGLRKEKGPGEFEIALQHDCRIILNIFPRFWPMTILAIPNDEGIVERG